MPAPYSSAGALLLDLRGLPDAVAEVVELGPADVAPGDPLDAGDGGRVQGKRALDPDAVADLADLEGLAHARARAADHHAPGALDPLLLPLDHPHVHLEGVAGREVGDVATQARLVDQVGGVHRASLRRRRRKAGRSIVSGPRPETQRRRSAVQPELGQQPAVVVAETAPGRHGVGPAVERAPPRPRPPPAGDARV